MFPNLAKTNCHTHTVDGNYQPTEKQQVLTRDDLKNEIYNINQPTITKNAFVSDYFKLMGNDFFTSIAPTIFYKDSMDISNPENLSDLAVEFMFEK